MPTYVLMTKLDPSATRDPRGRRKAGEDWLARVASLCPGLTWRSHYALLGPYDFMDVYDAPDEDTAFRVSMLSRELGAVSAESWPALAYDDFLPIAESVDSTAQGGGKKKGNKK